MEGALAPVADHRLGIWGSIGSGVCGFTHRLSGAWPIALCGFTPEQRTLDFAGYMADLIGRFGLEKHLEFIGRAMPPYPAMGQKLDLLFFDFRHGSSDLLAILGHFLP